MADVKDVRKAAFRLGTENVFNLKAALEQAFVRNGVENFQIGTNNDSMPQR